MESNHEAGTPETGETQHEEGDFLTALRSRIRSIVRRDIQKGMKAVEEGAGRKLEAVDKFPHKDKP